MIVEADVTPSEFYSKGIQDRRPYEDRAKKLSELTLPYVFRDESANGSTEYADSIEQSFCGRLINTLKAKVGIAILPPSTSPFKLTMDSKVLSGNGYTPEEISEVNLLLSNKTSYINSEIEVQQIRAGLFDVILQNLLVGSCVIEKVKSRGIKLHLLRNFVVELDSHGEAIKICIKEMLTTLPDGVESMPKEEYELYTMCILDESTEKWTMTQEIDRQQVGEPITYTKAKFPFQYIGWTWISGDKYHRPYAEDYYNDMVQYNTLSKVLTQGSVVASKSLIFVDQRGNRTKIDDIIKAKNGSVIDGSANDVTSFQLGKNFDFQVPMEMLSSIGRNLSQSFMMAESATRNAERVTAEEIRVMARELEESNLSGVYTKMTHQFTKRIVEWIMQELDIEFKEIGVHIVTGLDALGRSSEGQRLEAFVQKAIAIGVGGLLNMDEIIRRVASFDNINIDGIVKSKAQIAEEQKVAQDAQLQQQLMEETAKSTGSSIGGMAGQALTAQQDIQTQGEI